MKGIRIIQNQINSLRDNLILHRPWGRGKGWMFYASILFILVSACTSTRYTTHTKKSSVEQLLVARAVDKAIEKATLNIKGTKIFVDVTALLSDEERYVKKAVTHWLLKEGCLVTGEKREADIIASVLVKSAGTDGNQFFLGLPSVPIPLMAVSTPQINVFSGTTQKGYSELEIILYLPDSGLKERTAPLIGKSHFNKYTILFIPITSQNIYK